MSDMFNDDEDDDTPVEIEPDVESDLADVDSSDVVEDEEAAAPAPSKSKRPAARNKRGKARKAAKAAQKAAAKSAAKKSKKAAATPKKAAKGSKKKTSGKPARSATPPADLTGVKAGAHTLWVSKNLAGVLTSKDRRKLKALLRRAEKRQKAKK
jgi:hypothetical protein